MSEYVPHTETLGGLTLKIVNDDHAPESPLADDEAVVVAALHRNYGNPADDRTVHKANGEAYDFSTREGIEEFEQDNAGPDAPWAVFPLFMYEHGNVLYKASEGGNPFSCPWDSGRIGIIALNKSEVGTPGKVYNAGTPHESVGKSYLEQANGTLEAYTDWCNGNVFGYVIEDETGKHLESCWGYIGDYDGYVLEEGRNVLKALLKDHEPVHEFAFSRNEADLISAALMHSLETEFVSGAKYNEADRKGVEALLERIKSEFPFEGYTAAEVAAEREETV